MRKDLGPNPYLYPQPVMIIGTYDADGTPNAMNAAWGGTASNDQIVICLGSHATTDNIRDRGAFTVSFPDASQAVAADYVGIVSGRKVPDKVARAGWTAVTSAHVDAPIFEELPLALECEFAGTCEAGVLGRVVNVSVDESVLTADGKLDTDAFKAIVYEPVNHTYLELGRVVGQAFSDGRGLV